MMKTIYLEFYKTRRKKIWLIVFALIAMQLAWSLLALRNMDEHKLKQGWMFCLYQFPLLNSIMMPVIAAVVASRLSDVEHKGNTFKLLETVMPPGRLFDAKFLCGVFYMFLAVILQVITIALIGHFKGFKGNFPISMFAYYMLFTMCLNMTILLLQQVLSLVFINQMIPLTIGIFGSFAGLFIMFFPSNIAKLILWGYYGVLMFVGMDWDPASRISDFYWVSIDWPGFIALAAMFFIIYTTGRTLFIRKDI